MFPEPVAGLRIHHLLVVRRKETDRRRPADATAEQLEEYKAFFNPMKDQIALKRNIELGIIELSGKIEHIARDEQAVRNALLDL